MSMCFGQDVLEIEFMSRKKTVGEEIRQVEGLMRNFADRSSICLLSTFVTCTNAAERCCDPRGPSPRAPLARAVRPAAVVSAGGGCRHAARRRRSCSRRRLGRVAGVAGHSGIAVARAPALGSPWGVGFGRRGGRWRGHRRGR